MTALAPSRRFSLAVAAGAALKAGLGLNRDELTLALAEWHALEEDATVREALDQVLAPVSTEGQKMTKLTSEQWNEAFKNLEASPVSEDIKAYYRRVWTFEREERGYSFPVRVIPPIELDPVLNAERN